jgi:tRNA (cmo5U34)-methyltransferase
MSKGFDRIAGIYDRLARLVFGKAFVQSQVVFLDRLHSVASVLVVGGGTGWWMRDLVKINPAISITFLEASEKMIDLASRGIGENSSIRFIHGEHDQIPAGGKFDAVILFYFLDLFRDEVLLSVIERIQTSLKGDALWLVTDFVEGKKWHSLLLKIMYKFFYYAADLQTQSLPGWKRKMSEAGFKQIDEQAFFGRFISASLWA